VEEVVLVHVGQPFNYLFHHTSYFILLHKFAGFFIFQVNIKEVFLKKFEN